MACRLACTQLRRKFLSCSNILWEQATVNVRSIHKAVGTFGDLTTVESSLTQLARSGSVGGLGQNTANILTSPPNNTSINGLSSGPNLQRDAPGKDRKKMKTKTKPMAAPKPRTIKFHEYKVFS